MTNKYEQMYRSLVEKYKDVGKAVSDRALPKAKLEILIEADLTLLDNLGDLSLAELNEVQLYRKVAESLYRHSLELSWAEKSGEETK